MDEQQVYTAVPPRQLWFGVAAGPIVWAIHLVVAYALVSLVCNWSFFSFTMLGVPGIVAVLTLVTLAMGAIVLYAGLLAWRNWQLIEREAERIHGRREERHYFLAYSGVLLSALFLLVILLSLIPAFTLGPCAVV